MRENKKKLKVYDQVLLSGIKIGNLQGGIINEMLEFCFTSLITPEYCVEVGHPPLYKFYLYTWYNAN